MACGKQCISSSTGWIRTLISWQIVTVFWTPHTQEKIIQLSYMHGTFNGFIFTFGQIFLVQHLSIWGEKNLKQERR